MAKLMAYFLLAIPLSLNGCASIVHGPRQQVFLNSAPAAANVLISGKSGTTTAVTPAMVSLKRNSDYVVKFQKDGYVPKTEQIHHSASGWLFGNLLFGLVGIVVGGIADWCIGGAYKLNPTQITAVLEPEQKPSPTTDDN